MPLAGPARAAMPPSSHGKAKTKEERKSSSSATTTAPSEVGSSASFKSLSSCLDEDDPIRKTPLFDEVGDEEDSEEYFEDDDTMVEVVMRLQKNVGTLVLKGKEAEKKIAASEATLAGLCQPQTASEDDFVLGELEGWT